MRHNCATHHVIELFEMWTEGGSPRGVGRLRERRFDSGLDPRLGRRGRTHDNDTALMPVAVRAVHILVVAMLVIGLGVVQLIMTMRRLVHVLMHVSVLMIMRMAVRMLMHHVAMTVRMTMGVRMRVGVTMLVRMAVRLFMAMAMFVVAVRHLRVSRTGGELTQI